MADIELISNTHLQGPSSSCASCATSEVIGQKQGVNGNFSEHLNGSLQQQESANGEVLPNGGKKLPQSILFQEVTSSNSKLSIKSPQFDYFDSDFKSNILVENQAEVLEHGLASNFIGPEGNISLLPEENTALQVYSSLTEIVDALEDVEILELRETSENINQLVEELRVNPVVLTVPSSQTNNAAIKVALADSFNSITAITSNQQGLSIDTQPVGHDSGLDIFRNSSSDGIEPTLNTGVQRLETSDNSSSKLNDFIARYLSEDNVFKTSYKNQSINVENFLNNINAIKSEPALQNLGVSSVTDTYASINTGQLQNKTLDSPIPLLIKHGIGSEQVQHEVDQSIAQNIKWLIGNKAQNAKINVFPESLGQVNIALNLEDSNLKINFIATSNLTKDLIESSVSALRNHFSESGINLQEVNVETAFSGQSEDGSSLSNLNDQKEDSFNNGSIDGISDNDSLVVDKPVNISTALHLLDVYA